MSKKIKYVQLEPAEVLLDFHTSRMTAEQFGCYWLIVLNLYCNDGVLEFDIKEFTNLCNCAENFESVWKKIAPKFKKTKNKIRHKRVSNELKEAKRRRQTAVNNGLKGADARWQGHSKTDVAAAAKETEVKERKVKLNKENLTEGNERKANNEKQNVIDMTGIDLENGTDADLEAFDRQTRNSGTGNIFSSALASVTARSLSASGPLMAKQQSDRTSFRNICNRLMIKIQTGT